MEPGGRAKVRLKLSSRALRAAGAALVKGRRLTAKVTVTATDAAGNARTKKRAIRLKP